MKTSLRFAAVMAATCFLLFATAAMGADDDKAKAAFKKGSELFENGQHAAAAIQFKVAYKYKPTWKLFYNIGQSEAGAKRYGLALEAFEKYLVESGDEISEERRKEVRSEISRLRDMVGMLNVKGPRGAEVFVDGVKRGTLPLSGYLPVTASREHSVSGVLDERKLSMEKVKLMSGQVFEVTLELAPEDAAPVVAPVTEESEVESEAEEEGEEAADEDATEAAEEALAEENSAVASTGGDKGKPLKIAGIVAMAVGAGALGGSIVTGVMAKKKDDEIADACIDGVAVDGYDCIVDAEMEDTVNQRDTLGYVTTGLWIGGGTLVAAGVVLFVVGLKKGKEVAGLPTLTPVLAKGNVGGVLSWSF